MQFTVQPGGKLFTAEEVWEPPSSPPPPPPCDGNATVNAAREMSMVRTGNFIVSD